MGKRTIKTFLCITALLVSVTFSAVGCGGSGNGGSEGQKMAKKQRRRRKKVRRLLLWAVRSSKKPAGRRKYSLRSRRYWDRL